VTAGSSEYTANFVIPAAATDSATPRRIAHVISAPRSFLAFLRRPAASSRGSSALHAVKMGSVKNERSQNVSSATLCVAPGTTPRAEAEAVTAAYVPGQ